MATTKRTTRTPTRSGASAHPRPATRRGPRTVRVAVGPPSAPGPGDGVAPMIDERRAAGAVRILNCVPSSDQADDWDVTSAQAAGVLAARAALPASVDLRAAWWRIGDQGSTGSCVGWATADSVLRWHLVTTGRIAERDKLSVRFVWMAAKETDEFTQRPTTFIEPEGTSLKAALDVARRYGAVRDTDLPFARPKLFAGDAKAFYLLASQLKITAYVNLGRDTAAWRRWLATQGPILTRLDCDDTWMDARATKGVLATYDAASASGGHAVALVGYTADHFIVRNSWGTTWGDKGFAHASYPYATEAFTEAYGVNVA